MERYVKRGSELTRQILGFARGGKYQVKTINLNDLINKSADMFSRTKKEITIHKKFQEDLWSVEVDQGQIEQVLLNLFVNAWQAMPGGGNLWKKTITISLTR
jgi:signal transduction histidine kinase